MDLKLYISLINKQNYYLGQQNWNSESTKKICWRVYHIRGTRAARLQFTKFSVPIRSTLWLHPAVPSLGWTAVEDINFSAAVPSLGCTAVEDFNCSPAVPSFGCTAVEKINQLVLDRLSLPFHLLKQTNQLNLMFVL